MKRLMYVAPILVACAGPAGSPGAQGEPGVNGLPGRDGSSCTVIQVVEGALITCDDGSAALVSNGEPGSDGKDGEVRVVITQIKVKDLCRK